MPLQTITFERVFGIARRAQNYQAVTQFGFESGGLKQYAATVPGRPSIADGMTVTAYLKSEASWDRIAGWYNHSNGEIVVESALQQALMVLLCAASLARFWPWLAIHPLVTVCLAVMLLWLSALAARKFIFARRVRAELRRVKENFMLAGGDVTSIDENVPARNHTDALHPK
jgi:hypothetical protein